MKKHIFLAVVCALTLVGCQNNETDCYFHKKTINRTVRQSDWQFDDQGKLFFCNFDVPEITRDVYDKGSWTVYREYNHNTPNAYQAAIPMNLFINDTLTEDAVVYYTQYIELPIVMQHREVTDNIIGLQAEQHGLRVLLTV